MNNKRHKEILDIIKNNDIENQAMLISELRKRGIAVTQPTVSRDIIRLKLEKSLSDEGVYRYCVSEGVYSKSLSLFSLIQSVKPAASIVVITTREGAAQAVCASLDDLNLPEIVGTIAGDDTIFAATEREEKAASLAGKLRKFINEEV